MKRGLKVDDQQAQLWIVLAVEESSPMKRGLKVAAKQGGAEELGR